MAEHINTALEREHLLAILDSMKDRIYVIGARYEVEYVNAAIVNEHGPFRPGVTCFAYLYGRTEPCPWCKWQDVVGGKTVRGQMECPKTARAYDCFETPLVNPDGRISMLTILHDMTEQKQLESALRKSREKLELHLRQRTAESARTVALLEEEITQRKLTEKVLHKQSRDLDAFFSNTITPLVMLDRKFNFVRVNQAYADSCGHEPADLIGRNHFEFFPDEENQRIFEEVVRTKTPFRASAKPFLYQDHPEWGTTYWDWTLMPITDEQGDVEMLVFSLEDVTDRKQGQLRTEFTHKLLELFTHNTSRQDYLDSAVELIRQWSGCECVGIRLRDAQDCIPYASCVGFSDDFLATENCLSLKNDTCLCIRAITQRPGAQDIPLVTPRGAFCCENTFRFLDDLPEEKKKQYRGVCLQHGFASLAVIPVRYRDVIIGAIHLADRRENRTPPDRVEFLESVAMLIGEPVHRFDVEAELRNSESRLREAQRVAHLGNWEWTIALNTLWWSDEVYRIFGLTPGQLEVTYDTFLAYVHPEDRDAVNRAVQEALAGAKRYSIDHRVIRPDGIERVVHEQAEVVYDADHRPVRMIGTVHDITGRVRAEEAVRQSEQRFRLMAQASEDVFWMCTPGIGQILYISPAYEKLWGKTRRSLYQNPMSFLESVHPDDRDRLVAGLKGHAKGRWNYVYRIVQSDDAIRWVHDIGYPVRNAHGELTMMAGMIRDITAAKKAEAEILHQQKELRSLATQLQLAEERQRRRIAQDLHDSIGQILSFSGRELRRLQQTASPPLAKSLRQIADQLDTAVEQARSLSFDLSPALLYDLGLEVAIEDLAERMSKEHHFNCSFESCASPKPLRDDVKVLLYRSVRELLINAAKHAEADLVKIFCSRLESDIQITVQDNGRGFDVSVLSRRSSENGGFGLFNLRERLSHIGGCLKIESAKNRGTEATVIAPLNLNEDRQEEKRYADKNSIGR